MIALSATFIEIATLLVSEVLVSMEVSQLSPQASGCSCSVSEVLVSMEVSLISIELIRLIRLRFRSTS